MAEAKCNDIFQWKYCNAIVVGWIAGWRPGWFCLWFRSSMPSPLRWPSPVLLLWTGRAYQLRTASATFLTKRSSTHRCMRGRLPSIPATLAARGVAAPTTPTRRSSTPPPPPHPQRMRSRSATLPSEIPAYIFAPVMLIGNLLGTKDSANCNVFSSNSVHFKEDLLRSFSMFIILFLGSTRKD